MMLEQAPRRELPRGLLPPHRRAPLAEAAYQWRAP